MMFSLKKYILKPNVNASVMACDDETSMNENAVVIKINLFKNLVWSLICHDETSILHFPDDTDVRE